MNRFVFRPVFFCLMLFAVCIGISPAQASKTNFNRPRTFDAQHYLIRTSFDRSSKTIFGETIVSFKPLKNGLNSIELDAAGLVFESVTLEPGGTNLQYRTEGEKVVIALGRAFATTDLIKIRLKYSAKPKKGVYFVSAGRDADNAAYDAQIWTQGETEESRHWFPSYDFPDDKATTEQFLTVEEGETAISNGELLDAVSNSNGTKTFHFRMDVSHSVYLTSFVVGKYVKFSDAYKNVPLGVYLYPGSEYLNKQVFANTKEMMRIFEELTGTAFPFKKYDQTIVAQFPLGGMENITATTLSDRDIFFSNTNRMVVEDIVSHELAHSWFGNLVTCRNWAELWLNESFATFMEAAYREKMYGRNDYLRKIEDDKDIYFAEEARSGRKHGLFNQLARPDDSIFDAVTYQKGSAVLHTLRETVGDRVFWKAVNLYLAKHRLENVETADLRAIFETAAGGQDLGWFFKQWVYGTGYPKLEIKYQYSPAAKKLDFVVKQVQRAEDLTPAEFVLPLEVEIQTGQGATVEKLQITKRETTVSIKLNDAPTNVIIDKEMKIPLKTVKILNAD